MEESGKKKFLEVFTSLMIFSYPDCIVEGNKFIIESKFLEIEVVRTAFYFQLNQSKIRKVEEFKKNSTWEVPFLKFSIQLTASSGKTYSYPELRKYLGNNEEDILMTATYIFTCVNYTIKFFERGIQEMNFHKIMEMANKI